MAENRKLCGKFFLIASLLSFVPALGLSLYYLMWSGLAHWRRVLPLIMFAGYLTAVHMVFPGSIRYRIPLEPFMICLAAAGLRSIDARWNGKLKTRESKV
jgi:hypothetical protein